MDTRTASGPRLLARLLGAIGASLLTCGLAACGSETACFDLAPGETACPPPDAARARIALDCTERLVSVDSEGTLEDGACCYEITIDDVGDSGCIIEGRPLLVEHRMLVADVEASSAWSGDRLSPRLEDLGPAERAVLAEAWTRAGLHEHASVASFGRAALELLAASAPAELVAAAHAAALDEVGHARASFALASSYGGSPVGPGSLPLPSSLPLRTSLAELAAATVREGCVGETVAALVAAEQRARASDPAVLAALDAIARDEAAHAELAWRTLRWALDVGGPEVRRAVREAFASSARDDTEAADADDALAASTAALAAHGWLDARERRLARRAALRDVVRPCARALLAASVCDRAPFAFA